MDSFVSMIRLFLHRRLSKAHRLPNSQPARKRIDRVCPCSRQFSGICSFRIPNSCLVSCEFIDLVRQYRYELTSLPASEPLAQAVEHLPFKQRVAGSNPARLTSILPYFQAVAVSLQIAVRRLCVNCPCSVRVLMRFRSRSPRICFASESQDAAASYPVLLGVRPRQ